MPVLVIAIVHCLLLCWPEVIWARAADTWECLSRMSHERGEREAIG